MKADILALESLDIATFTASGNLNGLTHHYDHGSNYMPMVCTDQIIELGVKTSTGTIGDGFENALP